jgi:redox-sensitive bicupin YhaK (pirin superfamily)
MEIISYVLEGALSHKDSMGNETPILPGEVQRMSAGSGVVHSEQNYAKEQTTHFLQIWLLPARTGIEPGYAQKTFSEAQKRGRLCLVASPDGAEGSVPMNADARLYAGLFDAEEAADVALPAGRKTYVHLVRGELDVNGQKLTSGDAALIENEERLRLANGRAAEVLVFDLEP